MVRLTIPMDQGSVVVLCRRTTHSSFVVIVSINRDLYYSRSKPAVTTSDPRTIVPLLRLGCFIAINQRPMVQGSVLINPIYNGKTNYRHNWCKPNTIHNQCKPPEPVLTIHQVWAYNRRLNILYKLFYSYSPI